MNVEQQMAFQTAAIKQAVNTHMLKKAFNQEEQAMQSIMEMAPDVSGMTGVGRNLDIRV